MPSVELPSNADLVSPVLEALATLGGTGSNDEIRAEVIRILGLTPEVITKIHKGTRTELEYKLAWARTIAKQKGLIFSPRRLMWKLATSE